MQSKDIEIICSCFDISHPNLFVWFPNTNSAFFDLLSFIYAMVYEVKDTSKYYVRILPFHNGFSSLNA